MEVILKDDIKGLGYKDDLVKVKPGHGRNFLIPQGLAIVATEANKRVIAENVKQASHKAEKIKKDVMALVEKIGDKILQINAKVGESGKIFGAITSLQISDALKDQGIAVDRKKISFKTDVKEVGEYTAILDLHKEVKHEVKFKVIAQ